MKQAYYIMLALLTFSKSISAQSSMETILSNIDMNNKTIQANRQYWEAKKLEYKTGLTPNNPTIEYDFMIGTPALAGNQTDFVANQSFDFPTTYSKRKELSNEQIAQSEMEITSIRQEILLDAKKVCIELVYRNKMEVALIERKQNTEKWLATFQTKLEKGEGNILDLNKARLQLVEINATFRENSSAIKQLNQKLSELNGGNTVLLSDTIYPFISILPPFETLEAEIEVNDPHRKLLAQEKVIAGAQVELSKAMSLPKLETGYHYQAILGQRFNGFHLGISIPLWENKNVVKMHQANLILTELNLQDHLNEHFFHVQQTYTKQQDLLSTLNEYKTLFSGLNTLSLLDKSISLGQISTVEYFLEMTYLYNSWNAYLLIEKEYHLTIAELYKYKL